MTAFNPYYVDEIVTQADIKSGSFGLINDAVEATEEELHGYEVTMSGRLALPVLHPQTGNKTQQDFLIPQW